MKIQKKKTLFYLYENDSPHSFQDKKSYTRIFKKFFIVKHVDFKAIKKYIFKYLIFNKKQKNIIFFPSLKKFILLFVILFNRNDFLVLSFTNNINYQVFEKNIKNLIKKFLLNFYLKYIDICYVHSPTEYNLLNKLTKNHYKRKIFIKESHHAFINSKTSKIDIKKKFLNKTIFFSSRNFEIKPLDPIKNFIETNKENYSWIFHFPNLMKKDIKKTLLKLNFKNFHSKKIQVFNRILSEKKLNNLITKSSYIFITSTKKRSSMLSGFFYKAISLSTPGIIPNCHSYKLYNNIHKLNFSYYDVRNNFLVKPKEFNNLINFNAYKYQIKKIQEIKKNNYLSVEQTLMNPVLKLITKL